MQKMIGVVAALAMVAAAMPASADSSLYERNYNLLMSVLPAGSALEVQIVENGEIVTQIWTAEQFAAFRADKAALMGLDYTAGFQGAPSGLGDRQDVGDIWADLWGQPGKANVAVPRGLPRTVPIDDKLWLYGGAGSSTGAYESPGDCAVLFFGFVICDTVYGWTVNQNGARVGDSYHAGTGMFFNFGAPFGSSYAYDGVALSEL
jgi:hypothetical protein